MRCSNPGVPGMAHGRASVSGWRSYGRKVPSGSAAAKGTDRSGSSPTSGSAHGSELLAMYPSESRITGVM